jgi:hypothetical protein
MKKLFIIFAVLCLAAPAMAADWNFYGSARMATFWSDTEINDFATGAKPADSDMDVLWGQQGNSRIGANVKFNDQIGGRFEMSDSFGKRMLYGTYTFGNGSELLLGQTYTPSSSYFYSNSVYGSDGDLLGMGQFYVGRVPMIQWKMGGLKVALVSPNNGGSPVSSRSSVWGTYSIDPVTGVATLTTDSDINKYTPNAVNVPVSRGTISDVDITLPKIEVAYKFKTDMFFVDVFGGYQTYDLDSATGKDHSIDSYVFGLGGGATFGPAYLNVGGHMGQNLGNYGAALWLLPANLSSSQKTKFDDAEAASASYDRGREEIIDNDGLGYLAVVGFNASEMFTIEAGYGYSQYELDEDNSQDINATQYYLNCTINIAPGFFIVPEIGKVDYEIAGEDFGDFMYYGAKWQINF